MSEPLTRAHLAPALLFSLVLHLLLLGGLSRFDHVRENAAPPVPETMLITLATVAQAPPPAIPASAEPPPAPVAPEPPPARKPPSQRADAPASLDLPLAGAPDSAVPAGRTTEERPPPVEEEARADVASTPVESRRDGDVIDDGRTHAYDDDYTPPSPRQMLIGEARLEFDVFRGGSLHIGRTRYHWVHDGTRYRMETVTETTGLAGLLKPLRIDQSSEGELTDSGLRPMRYAQDARQAKPADEQVVFDWANNRVMLSRGEQRSEHPLLPGSQDMISLWLEVIWRAQVGGEFDFSVASGRRYSPRWFVPDAETSSLETGFGRLLVQRIRIRAQPGDNQVEIWLAPNLRWLPVRIQFTDRKGDVYDQRIRQIEYDKRTLSATPGTTAATTSGESLTPQVPKEPDMDIPIFLR